MGSKWAQILRRFTLVMLVCIAIAKLRTDFFDDGESMNSHLAVQYGTIAFTALVITMVFSTNKIARKQE